MELIERDLINDFGITPLQLMGVFLSDDESGLAGLSASVAESHWPSALEGALAAADAVVDYVEHASGRVYKNRRKLIVQGVLDIFFGKDHGSLDDYVGPLISDTDMKSMGW